MEELKDKAIKKIKKNEGRLEKELGVKIQVNGNKIELEGEEVDKFGAKQVLRALDRNFKIGQALLLKEEDYSLEDIPIKKSTPRKDLSAIKARIIGREAKTIQLLNQLSECYITLHNNTVSILGPHEKMKTTIIAIKKLIQGSDQSKVYNYLERERKKSGRPKDIGLKESFKKKLEKNNKE